VKQQPKAVVKAEVVEASVDEEYEYDEEYDLEGEEPTDVNQIELAVNIEQDESADHDKSYKK
jgi:hypothetical protein